MWVTFDDLIFWLDIFYKMETKIVDSYICVTHIFSQFTSEIKIHMMMDRWVLTDPCPCMKGWLFCNRFKCSMSSSDPIFNSKHEFWNSFRSIYIFHCIKNFTERHSANNEAIRSTFTLWFTFFLFLLPLLVFCQF